MHEKRIVICDGPEAEHAFDTIPLVPRRGSLDALCPTCHGHGQWNGQIDLISFRSIRVICDRCDGHGWIETGDDAVPEPDIVTKRGGAPRWVER